MKQTMNETDDGLATVQLAFGKNVNQYLNTAIAFADAKATAFLAASLTVGAALNQFSNSSVAGGSLRTVAVLSLSMAVIASALVILPRLGSARRGLIFWDDIRSYADADDYLQAVSTLTPRRVEAEYAAQNYFVAEIAQKKHDRVRLGIWFFIAGLSSTVAAYLAG